MSTADLTQPIFTDETAAREYLEAQRWPDAVNCPHCGSLDGITKMQGKSHRPGLFNCNACRKPFSVTVGTVYERSHIPPHKWLLATHLLCSSKKGMSAHQLHRLLGITYKSAWFMCHRIREAMKDDGAEPMGGEGKTVEMDETYQGVRSDRTKKRAGAGHKRAVVTLVERGGKARSFHVDKVSIGTVMRIAESTLTRRQRSRRTRASSTTPLAVSLTRTRPSTTRAASTFAAPLTRTRLRASSPSSSAA